MIAKRVIFTGRVQGVGFRYTTREIANSFDVRGTVKNLPDGSVELVIVGEAGEVAEYLLEITDESPVSHFIKDVAITEITPRDDLRGFRIVS